MSGVCCEENSDLYPAYGERRDCADQRIPQFLEACGYISVSVSKVILDLAAFVNTVNPTGILLTGGNSLEKYSGNAPEWNRTSHWLIDIALRYSVVRIL